MVSVTSFTGAVSSVADSAQTLSKSINKTAAGVSKFQRGVRRLSEDAAEFGTVRGGHVDTLAPYRLRHSQNMALLRGVDSELAGLPDLNVLGKGVLDVRDAANRLGRRSGGSWQEDLGTLEIAMGPDAANNAFDAFNAKRLLEKFDRLDAQQQWGLFDPAEVAELRALVSAIREQLTKRATDGQPLVERAEKLLANEQKLGEVFPGLTKLSPEQKEMTLEKFLQASVGTENDSLGLSQNVRDLAAATGKDTLDWTELRMPLLRNYGALSDVLNAVIALQSLTPKILTPFARPF
jgi:hypothetical protein